MTVNGELEREKSLKAANKKNFETLVQLTGVQGARDHEPRVLQRMWSCCSARKMRHRHIIHFLKILRILEFVCR